MTVTRSNRTCRTTGERVENESRAPCSSLERCGFGFSPPMTTDDSAHRDPRLIAEWICPWRSCFDRQPTNESSSQRHTFESPIQKHSSCHHQSQSTVFEAHLGAWSLSASGSPPSLLTTLLDLSDSRVPMIQMIMFIAPGLCTRGHKRSINTS